MYIANDDYVLSSGRIKKGSELKYEAKMTHANGKEEIVFKVGRKIFVTSAEKFEDIIK